MVNPPQNGGISYVVSGTGTGKTWVSQNIEHLIGTEPLRFSPVGEINSSGQPIFESVGIDNIIDSLKNVTKIAHKKPNHSCYFDELKMAYRMDSNAVKSFVNFAKETFGLKMIKWSFYRTIYM